jgi:hypothetical protein
MNNPVLYASALSITFYDAWRRLLLKVGTCYITNLKVLKSIVVNDCPYSSILTCKSQRALTRRESQRVKSNELNSPVKQINRVHFFVACSFLGLTNRVSWTSWTRVSKIVSSCQVLSLNIYEFLIFPRVIVMWTGLNWPRKPFTMRW